MVVLILAIIVLAIAYIVFHKRKTATGVANEQQPSLPTVSENVQTVNNNRPLSNSTRILDTASPRLINEIRSNIH